MRTHVQTVRVDGPDGPVEIGTVQVSLYDSLKEIPENEIARVLKDANRQRIQDAANAFREDYKTGGTRRLKARRDELIAMLGKAKPEQQAELVAELVKVNAQIG